MRKVSAKPAIPALNSTGFESGEEPYGSDSPRKESSVVSSGLETKALDSELN